MTFLPPTWQNDEAWSKIVLAGFPSPGVVKLSEHERVIGWDIAGAKGQDGAMSSRKGEPLGEFTATFDLTDEPSQENGLTDWDEWPFFQDLLESSINGDEPVALEIVHPDLQRNHFTAVVLGSIGPTVKDGKGGGTIAVKLQEHRPPQKKASGGASKTKTSPETEGDKAVREAEKELEDQLRAGTET